MSETFELDTSGYVSMIDPLGFERERVSWSDLSPFARRYTAAILTEVGVAFHQLAPETLATILRDCEACERMLEPMRKDGTRSSAESGRKFWFLRQDCFPTLLPPTSTSFTNRFPPLHPTLCDDGKVRFE